MSLRKMAKLLALAWMVAGLVSTAGYGQDGQLETSRRAKSKIAPAYPDLARKMNLTGTVKVEVVVAPNGVVKDAKVIGGHPVLGNAALDAVKKWRFEPAAMESSGIVDFKFEPHQ